MIPPKVLKKYFSNEITEMENNSKLRAKMMESNWFQEKRKNDPNYFQRVKHDYTIRRKIDLQIFKLTRQVFTNYVD